MTVGVLYDPWPAWRRGRVRRYWSMVEFKANPRSREYMTALFLERYPAGRIVMADEMIQGNRVVLLYPDAVGLGWTQIERRITVGLARETKIRVLNGRGRDFLLDHRTRRQLRLRRTVELGLVGEAVLTAAFVMLTPPLLAWDIVRGRR
jgi:hypothetical protein